MECLVSLRSAGRKFVQVVRQSDVSPLVDIRYQAPVQVPLSKHTRRQHHGNYRPTADVNRREEGYIRFFIRYRF